MAEWEKEIAELKTDVKYIREDVNIMQKQIRDLNKHTNMGLGGTPQFGDFQETLDRFFRFR